MGAVVPLQAVPLMVPMSLPQLSGGVTFMVTLTGATTSGVFSLMPTPAV